MAEVERISVQDARRAVAEGRALLVCGYDDETKCGPLLDGAMTMRALQSRLGSLPKSQELIFYCG
jgi:hypothetical protein